jgi:hypothetical protein
MSLNINDLYFMNDLYSKSAHIFDDIGNGTEIKNLINKEEFNDNKINKNNNFDFLLDDVPPQQKTTKKLNQKIVKKKDTINIYIFMIILFYLLNSYYIINLINSNKISYNTSLLIRGTIFLLFYWLYKKID